MNLLDNDVTETLKAWGTKRIKVQSNLLIAVSRPTTQEDNYGEILERMDLYTFPNKLFNGVMADIKEGKDDTYKCGHLVKYMDGGFAVFNGRVRFDILKEDICFI